MKSLLISYISMTFFILDLINVVFLLIRFRSIKNVTIIACLYTYILILPLCPNKIRQPFIQSTQNKTKQKREKIY